MPRRTLPMYGYTDEPGGWKVFVLVAVVLSIIFVGIALVVGSARAQTPDGRHPHPTGPDPYKDTKTIKGLECCHGTHCSRFSGEVRQETRNGRLGYLFGRWFVPAEKLIDARTLPAEERAFDQLCISDYALSSSEAFCGYVAAPS